MTAQDDVNIIENEFKGTAKLSDGVRVHTHTRGSKQWKTECSSLRQND